MVSLIGWSFHGRRVGGRRAAATQPVRAAAVRHRPGLVPVRADGDRRPGVFTVGLLTAPWWLGLFLHALLAFPTGRLGGRVGSPLVALLYVDVTLLQALRLSTPPRRPSRLR